MMMAKNGVNYIVKNDSWNKDYSDDRSIDIQNLVPDSDGYYHIYLQTGSGTIYTDSTQSTVYSAS